MPLFVPVQDVEKSKAEQMLDSIKGKDSNLAKHRRWDNPYSIQSSASDSMPEMKRGWEQGQVGWGVQGSFGHHDKDDGSHIIHRNTDSKHKMIRDEKGLWIRVKKSNEEEERLEKKSIGRGALIDSEYSTKRSLDDDIPIRRSTNRSLTRSSESRDRQRRRSRSRDRSDRSHRFDSRHQYRRERSRSRSRDRKQLIPTKHENKVLSIETHNSIEDIKVVITAIVVVNRFIEMFGAKIDNLKRLNSIAELISSTCMISHLKTHKCLLSGFEAIKVSFSKTKACFAEPSRRVFIELDNRFQDLGFCLDYYRPLCTPGLGDRSKHCVVLYECKDAKICHIWGLTDSECISTNTIISKEMVFSSLSWKYAKDVMFLRIQNKIKEVSSFEEAIVATHFHDYSCMQTIG